MAHVIVEVNGRPYTMQCPDGEEEHLRELARLLDSEVQRIRQSVGTVGDIRLLVMSGLMVADRLSEAIARIEALEGELSSLNRQLQVELETRVETEAKAATQLDIAARRLNELSQTLGAK